MEAKETRQPDPTAAAGDHPTMPAIDGGDSVIHMLAGLQDLVNSLNEKIDALNRKVDTS